METRTVTRPTSLLHSPFYFFNQINTKDSNGLSYGQWAELAVEASDVKSSNLYMYIIFVYTYTVIYNWVLLTIFFSVMSLDITVKA